MAKSTTRSRRPQPQQQPHPEPEERNEQPATAVVAPPAPAEAATGEDVASFDAETNAKYEQVKGGKLYIKDLQQMDVGALHEIARQLEQVVDACDASFRSPAA